MSLAGSEYRRATGKVEITLAPLIDMMFLLLIFFMVATVFPDDRGVNVKKPEMATAGEISRESLVVKITTDGRYFVEGEQVSIDEAAQRVANAPDRPVTLEADRDARVEAVTRALDAFKQAGARSLAIAAEQASK